MTRALTAWLILWSVGLTSRAGAELRLEQVVASVEAHHPLLMSELSLVEAASAEARAARGELDTTLSVQGRAAALGYYDKRTLDILLEQPTTLLGTTLYSGYRIGSGRIPSYYGEQATLDKGELRGGVRVPLWEGRSIDSRRAAILGSLAGQRGAAANVRVARLELERAAAVAYFVWVGAGLRERVAFELLKLASERDAQIASKVALGALPSIERLENQRAIMDRTQRLVQARRAREKVSLELSLYLRDDAGRPLVATFDDVPAEMPGPDTLPSLEAAMERGLTTRPELAAYEALLEQAQVELSLAENRVAPRFDVFGEVSKDLGDGPSELLASRRPAVLEVGATLTLPLWLRKSRGKRDAAEAKLDATESKAAYARDKVVYEMRDAYSAERAAVDLVKAARTAAGLAEQLAQGERARLELGATTLLFVNLREQQAADAQVNVIDAMGEWNVAHARARAAMGVSLQR